MAMRIRVEPLPQVAAIYTRVSTLAQDEDDKTSSKTQQDGCRAWALSHGFAVAEGFIYHDAHTGEELWQRPQLTWLREAARARQFAVVVCHSVDRLSRDETHLLILLDEMERLGVKVEFVVEPIDDSDEGRAIRFMKGWAGKIESERRKERTMRTVRERATSGKYVPSNRPAFGYAWGPEVDHKGRLTKVRLVVDPLTAPIVVRIYEDVASGKSLRAVALALTQEGIPTPTGRAHGRWTPTTIRTIITLSHYWGAAEALTLAQVPRSAEMRKYYRTRTARVARPAAERVPLPPDVVPAIVSVELALEAQARLARNRHLNAINRSKNPHPALMRGGLVRCATCGNVLAVKHTPARPGGRKERWRYVCCANGIGGRCREFAIETHRLDTAVWAKVCQVLRDPDFIQREVDAMQATDAPGTDMLAVIDARLAAVSKRIANKHKYAEGVEDDEERAALTAEVNLLVAEKRGIEQERAKALAHYSRWHEKQQGLERAVDWCRRWGRNLDRMDYEARRGLLVTIEACVTLYDRHHTPRATLSIVLPVSGESEPLPLFAGDDSVQSRTANFIGAPR
jgi:site-specific DNA recombinase